MPNSCVADTAHPGTRHDLRKHQLEALAALQEHFVERGRARGQLISACGSGKTVTSAHFVEMSGSKLVLFLVPNLNLVSQTWEAYRNQLGDVFDGFIICSDDKRAVSDEERDSDDLLATQAPDDVTDEEVAAKWNGRVLRDATDIGAALSGARDSGRLTIVFSTYQSAHRLTAGVNKSDADGFDLAICDEAHFLTGQEKSGRASTFRNVVSRIPVARRLFMTATPRFVEGSRWSMDNTDVFGSVAHWFTYQEAVERKIVAPFDIYITQVDREKDSRQFLKDLRGRFGITETLDRNLAVSHEEVRSMAVAASISQLLEEGEITRVLTYSNRRKRLEENAKDINALVGEGRAVPLSYKSSTEDRQQGVADLTAGRINVITNCNLFTEGHDTPDLDAIAFVDPRKSVIDIVQAIGRACRLPAGREGKVAKVIIPVDDFTYNQEGSLVVDSKGTGHLSTEKKKSWDHSFAPVEAVLAALKHSGLNLVDAEAAIKKQLRGEERPVPRDVPSITEQGALEDLMEFDDDLMEFDDDLDTPLSVSVALSPAAELLASSVTDDSTDNNHPATARLAGLRGEDFQDYLEKVSAPEVATPDVGEPVGDTTPRVFVSRPFAPEPMMPTDLSDDTFARADLVRSWLVSKKVRGEDIFDMSDFLKLNVEEQVECWEGTVAADALPAVKLFRAYEQLSGPVLRADFLAALPSTRATEIEVNGKLMYAGIDRGAFGVTAKSSKVRDRTRLMLADAVRLAIYYQLGEQLCPRKILDKALNVERKFRSGAYPHMQVRAAQAFRYATNGRLKVREAA